MRCSHGDGHLMVYLSGLPEKQKVTCGRGEEEEEEKLNGQTGLRRYKDTKQKNRRRDEMKIRGCFRPFQI